MKKYFLMFAASLMILGSVVLTSCESDDPVTDTGKYEHMGGGAK